MLHALVLPVIFLGSNAFFSFVLNICVVNNHLNFVLQVLICVIIGKLIQYVVFFLGGGVSAQNFETLFKQVLNTSLNDDALFVPLQRHQ